MTSPLLQRKDQHTNQTVSIQSAVATPIMAISQNIDAEFQSAWVQCDQLNEVVNIIFEDKAHRTDTLQMTGIPHWKEK